MTEAQQGARADSMFVANDTAFGGLPGDTVWFDTAYFRGPVVADTAFAEAIPFESTTPHVPIAALWVVIAIALAWVLAYGRRR